MGGTDGVEAIFLELLDAPDPQGVGNRSAHARGVLVDVRTADADRFPVHQNPAVGIERDDGKRQLRLFRFRTDSQPDMPIDARPLIEPSFLKGSIDSDGHDVVSTVIQILGDIVTCCSVTALLSAQPEAVHPDVRIAEDAVETERYGLAERFGRDGEMLAIPAHTGFGPLPAHRLIAVAVRGFGSIRQVHDPVVGQLYLLPGRIVKVHGIRALVVDGRRLGEIIEIFRAPSEILFRRGGVAEGELPAVVEQHFLGGQPQGK